MTNSSSFTIRLTPEARRNLDNLPKETAERIVQDANKFLTVTPYRTHKTRIKKLQHIGPSIYRLRVGDYRAYYRLANRDVHVLKVIHKKDADRWLKFL